MGKHAGTSYAQANACMCAKVPSTLARNTTRTCTMLVYPTPGMRVTSNSEDSMTSSIFWKMCVEASVVTSDKHTAACRVSTYRFELGNLRSADKQSLAQVSRIHRTAHIASK